MKHSSTYSLTLLSLVLVSCGTEQSSVKETSSLKGVDDKGGWVLNEGDEAGNQTFNLAKFATLNEHLKTSLGKHSEAGHSYLAFGQTNLFRAEMNLTVQTFGDKSDAASERKIAAGYWLDGYAFGKKMGDKSGRGYILDVGALAHMDTLKGEAVVRFGGKELYRAETREASDEKTFTRDFNYGTTYYPVPMLGVKVSGTIGGEIGYSAHLGVRRDNALGLNFAPRGIVNAGLTGGVQALQFASAEAIGSTMVADLKIGSSANLGLIPSSHLAYGNIGIEGGEFKALDGKVEILAKAGLGNIIPEGVGRDLWTKILDTVGLAKNYQWRHTVWDPELVLVKKIPRMGTQFAAFYIKPQTSADCKTAQTKAHQKVDEHVDTLAKFRDSSDGMLRLSTEAALSSFISIKGRIAFMCK